MKKHAAILLLIFALVMGMTGCAKKVIVSPPRPQAPKPVPAPPPPPPEPTRAEILDEYHKTDYHAWKKMMKTLITKEDDNIPAHHLRYAIKEFNSEETRETCLTASYLYLKARARENMRLEGDDLTLFKKFAEYMYTHTDANATDRIKSICHFARENEVCREIR